MSERDLFRVAGVEAIEVLDSRGNPTVQVEVHTRGLGMGRFIVPSGASKGRFEAHELRDGDPHRYAGLGVRKAVDNVIRKLGPAIMGLDAREQARIDKEILALDGTERKEVLGANAILGVSMATAKAAANTLKVPLYKYLQSSGQPPILPLPMMNILNGGKHAGNNISFQEFMILPAGFSSYHDALRAGVEVYHALGSNLRKKYGASATNVGDEGGYAPVMSGVIEALDAVATAVEDTGYSLGKQVFLGIDPAAGSFYQEKTGTYKVDGKQLRPEQLLELYEQMAQTYPLISIEDPFNDEDFTSFSRITETLGRRVQIVGDDLFVTNSKRVETGIRMHAANSLLVKVNQAGTLTETLQAIETARSAKYRLVISHRSGDTEDDSIADLAVGLSAGQIKTGAPARGERTSKYNRLLRIENEIGEGSSYYGPLFLNP